MQGSTTSKSDWRPLAAIDAVDAASGVAEATGVTVDAIAPPLIEAFGNPSELKKSTPILVYTRPQ
jgi:hypothetical protein